MKKLTVLATVLASLGLTATASADLYVGSACSFADFPLASHNKIHHRLVNTSGASQFVTCPITRRKTGSIGMAALYYSTSLVQFARLEIRQGSGGVFGWDPDAPPRASALGGFLSDWFNSAADGAAGPNDQLVLEAFLPNNASINGYRVDEN